MYRIYEQTGNASSIRAELLPVVFIVTDLFLIFTFRIYSTGVNITFTSISLDRFL